MPSYVRVQNMQNGRSVVVRVNDRGPFHENRIIDVSKRVAQVLDLKNSGLARVRVTYVGRADLSGNDDWLVTTVQDNGRAVPPTQVAAMAPVPAWAATPATGPSPTQLALQDRLAPSGPTPVPLERPREQPVQVASIAPIAVPPASRMPAALAATASAAPPLPAVVTQALAPMPAPSAAPVTGASATVAAAASGPPLALTPLPQARPATASATAQPPAVGAPIFVQVGSFRDPQQAMRYRDALARHGTAVVEPVNVSGITFHQLRVGPFRQQAQADGAMREAQSLGATNARLSGI
jgi:rare lipoprotein A